MDMVYNFIQDYPYHAPSITENYTNLLEHSKSLKNRIRQAEPVLQLDELEHVREQGASEITSDNEIVSTELLNGVFNDLSPEPIAAPHYCFVIDEKVEEMDIKLQEVLI
ncbi:21470_t:CDS:2 [Entrophospora sp. SA101]|nr:4923_t:CDS:2 [Entrophospora sp. SA101]CAJ0755482.1 21470_t:CDS:2 [Entrophospora sp. SA101]